MEARSVDDALATLTVLQRDFRAWAMWRDGSGEWTATRSQPGSAQLLWVTARTPEELARHMDEADE